MPKLILSLLVCFWAASAFAANPHAPAPTYVAAPATKSQPDSRKMQKDLQQLNWKQFRSVLVAIPKMKAEVDAYGPLGWQYIRENYTTYGWKKSIDRLDDTQKQRLAELIQNAKVVR